MLLVDLFLCDLIVSLYYGVHCPIVVCGIPLSENFTQFTSSKVITDKVCNSQQRKT